MSDEREILAINCESTQGKIEFCKKSVIATGYFIGVIMTTISIAGETEQITFISTALNQFTKTAVYNYTDLKSLNRSIHVAPFPQGLSAHSLVSLSHREPSHPSGHRHRYPNTASTHVELCRHSLSTDYKSISISNKCVRIHSLMTGFMYRLKIPVFRWISRTCDYELK